MLKIIRDVRVSFKAIHSLIILGLYFNQFFRACVHSAELFSLP